MRIAIVIGHSVLSQGAKNEQLGLSEYQFNELIAQDVARELVKEGFTPFIIYRQAYVDLPNDINQTNPDLILSLHCNAFDAKASGTTMIYCGGSTKGKIFAECLQQSVVNALGLRDRGIEGRTTGRGVTLLKNTKAPVVIAEPFFIDNYDELLSVLEKEDHNVLSNAYVSAIIETKKRFQNSFVTY
ncbi:hypothetical protein XM72_c10883 [Vibrio vulnificus]|uniref:N-acetylmuramoyl-L-alanine amidase n=1 Tax=Vibrio vulnificus TaxID=672 RepID=UPI0009B6855A|nr:N-acetylmuramoyl-L-alanine amidase [Vibrio vulnificus]OQK43992.1 hypothetical protein XM72_c10883 [Vibrio vulnificus]